VGADPIINGGRLQHQSKHQQGQIGDITLGEGRASALAEVFEEAREVMIARRASNRPKVQDLQRRLYLSAKSRETNADRRRLSDSRLRKNLTSGWMWQGVETQVMLCASP